MRSLFFQRGRGQSPRRKEGGEIRQMLQVSRGPLLLEVVPGKVRRIHDASSLRRKHSVVRRPQKKIPYAPVAHLRIAKKQAEDWKEQHKLECRYRVEMRGLRPSLPCRASSAEEDAVPLLLRTFHRLKYIRDGGNGGGCDASRGADRCAGPDAVRQGGDAPPLVDCGPDHFSAMTASPTGGPTTSAASMRSPACALAVDLMGSHAIRGRPPPGGGGRTEAALAVWGHGGGRSTIDAAVRRTLDAFRRNNFGIVDSLHSPVGEGVYPCAALLNHSCVPNCVLRYELGAAANDDDDDAEGRYHPPILVIVACRDVTAGEELRHSYVDLSLVTEARRARLFDTHGFVCECERCSTAGGGGCSIGLPTNRDDWDLWPLRDGLRAHGGEGLAGRTIPSLVRVRIDDAMTASEGISDPERHAMDHKTGVLRQRARQSMIDDDAEGELQCLNDAIKVYASQGNGRKWLSPFHGELYALRCEYLSALLANGRIVEAIEQCEHIVSFLAVAFSHVGCHPLLGLQLFTLGDLYTGAISSEEGSLAVKDVKFTYKMKAKAAYSWAKKIMVVTHGAKDYMVQTLDDNLANL